MATREAGVPVQSGTVPVERLWAILKSMLPPAARRVSLRWFQVLALVMLLRHNFGHFRNKCPGSTDGDPLLAQQLETFEMLIAAMSDGNGLGGLDHLSPLFDPLAEP